MKISHLTVTLGLLALVACSADTTPSKPVSTDAPARHEDATSTGNTASTPSTTTATTDATTVPATKTPDPAPVAPASDTCLGVLEAGGRFSTSGISREDCSDECNQNAALNPDDTVTCTWNGMPVEITSVGTCKGSIGGGSFSTAGISRDGCVDECRGNANLNPGANVVCTWNGAALAF